jgi:hypothetical protein
MRRSKRIPHATIMPVDIVVMSIIIMNRLRGHARDPPAMKRVDDSVVPLRNRANSRKDNQRGHERLG